MEMQRVVRMMFEEYALFDRRKPKAARKFSSVELSSY